MNPRPYGGSVTMASTDSGGMAFIVSMQSPLWMVGKSASLCCGMDKARRFDFSDGPLGCCGGLGGFPGGDEAPRKIEVFGLSVAPRAVLLLGLDGHEDRPHVAGCVEVGPGHHGVFAIDPDPLLVGDEDGRG